MGAWTGIETEAEAEAEIEAESDQQKPWAFTDPLTAVKANRQIGFAD